jgi:hypothetical protein
MRSRRSRFELASRVTAFGLLGWLLGAALFPPPHRRTESASAANLSARLGAWTGAAPGTALHGDFVVVPPPWEVAWLAALSRSGHAVSWSGTPPAVAMSVEQVADPLGGSRIAIAAPPGTRVLVRDAEGSIDSVRVARLGASVIGPEIVDHVVGIGAGQLFGAPAPDSASPRAVVVVGSASWEGKFIASALEERGWTVIAHFSVAPNVVVGQAPTLQLDTSRVSAVVAVDTTLGKLGGAIARFVRSGGGLVLAGPSGASRSVALLAPGVLGPRVRPATEPTGPIGLGSTGFYPVTALATDGVAVELRDGRVAVAARRVGAGRVVQVGYDDTWRWRMTGANESEDAHRAWWSRVVASVAYLPDAATRTSPSPRDMDSSAAIADGAPLARMVDRLGPPRGRIAADSGVTWFDQRTLIVWIMLLLLAEWASRRMRGLK